MNGWNARDYAIPQAVSGIVTNQVISLPYPISAEGALYQVIKITASSVTSVGTITAKLQTAINGDWVDSKTVVITASGNFYIKLQTTVAADQTFLPLLNQGRLVLTTTNAGDAVTIDAVNVLEQL